MRKLSFVVLLAACAAVTLSSCASHEPAPASQSQSAAKKKQQIGVGSESVNQPGRSDPSGASTGQAVDVGQEGLNQGRGDPSGASTGASVGAGGETVNDPGR